MLEDKEQRQFEDSGAPFSKGYLRARTRAWVKALRLTATG